MPPIVPRKRLRESLQPSESKSNKATKATANSVATERRKATLYDDLDATATPQSSSKNSNSLLHGLADDDSESSLTSLSDEEFEDVPLSKPDQAADSDEDIEFEDVEAPEISAPDAPAPTGDLELTLIKDTRMSLTNQYGDKRGPTKRERKVRNASHSVHVLSLLWHNAVRNSWLCDPEVQATMISHIPPKLWDEVERWQRSSGLVKPSSAKKSPEGKSKRGAKGKGKKPHDRKSRDWSDTAERLEEGVVDMSHGDPLFRLMKVLASWWKQRFRITAPGLRKWGYMALERLDRLTKAHKAEDHDPLRFGERFRNLEDFRHCARSCEGSRDAGAQLFTALLRGLGLEARMVANLQTLGFGWNKLEDAEPEKDGEAQSSAVAKEIPSEKESKKRPKKQVDKKAPKASQRTRGRKAEPSSDSDELEVEYQDTDDESVVDVKISARRMNRTATSRQSFDKDLAFPHYWTEVLSPVTKKYLPVEPIVKNVIGTNRELIESLEPRGAKADKARQIMAYIVGFSQDGTAKDVTVRYLKRNMFPGRTKGVRMPSTKVPVYNRHGKVKRYEQFDWFKTAMSGYRRGTRKNPITEVDELEDTTDLTPVKPEKKEVKEGEETLQYYKQSKEYVLERHLKREEALKPGAKAVKVFKNKAKGGKIQEEDVFMRADVVNVKSAETWHKQGRAPIVGERPLKHVPYRAATLNRKREILEAEAATGQKVLQGLFSFDQTDWIIPDPIKDGVIPKNEYGNIDLFAEHMCPEGAVHVPFRGAVRVCKKLQIDFAEAVVDFEFGHRMAVPVIQGVVIAEENHDLVMEELEKFEAERARKEDEKRKKAALGMWRKFIMGMRIAERIRQEYGEIDESISVFGHGKGVSHAQKPPEIEDEEMAGGFFPEGYVEEEEEAAEAAKPEAHHTSSFFPAVDEDDDGDDGLVMEDHTTEMNSEVNGEASGHESKDEQDSEMVLEAASKPKAKGLASRKKRVTTRRSTRRRKVVDTDEDESEIEDEGDSDDDYEN